jgi:hypothetical protein
MLNPHDLKIGNLFINAANEIDTVTELSEQYVTGKEFAVPYPSANGVPLNEEWLARLGFEEHADKGLYRKANFFLHHYRFSKTYCFKYNDYKSSEIQYVHQLQNLFYALTGEELEIKERAI